MGLLGVDSTKADSRTYDERVAASDGGIATRGSISGGIHFAPKGVTWGQVLVIAAVVIVLVAAAWRWFRRKRP